MVQISNLRRLIGKTVVGPGGERIGKVAAVYEATGDGDGTFATVTTGLFGTHASFVPLAAAELQDDELHVPYSKDVVKHAPHVADDQDLTAAEEERLFAYYDGVDGAAAAPETAGPAAVADGTMTRSEERLHVTTERVETGRARLRKYVVTETVTQTVPVSHEELRIVREPIAPGEGDTVTALSEEEHEVVLSAERPVVQREVVPVERIRLATETVTGEETITEQVRKEQVEVLSDGPVHERSGVSGPPPAATEEVVTHSELVVEPRRSDEPGDRDGDGGDGTTTEFVIEPRH